MSSNPQPQSKPRLSPALIGGGILVIALGFGLPMLTSGSLPEFPSREPAVKQPPAAAPPAEAKASTPAPAPGPAPIQPPSATGLGASLLRLAVGLVVVCGLCVLVARWMGQKAPTAPGPMEVLASIAVARCVIHLVRAGERRLLIGTDFAGVKAILELPGPEPALPPDTALAAADSPSEPTPPPTPPDSDSPTTQEEILKLLLRLHSRPAADGCIRPGPSP